MTSTGKKNHYNIKFLSGYGFSVKVKDSKIVLKNCFEPFSEPQIEDGIQRTCLMKKSFLVVKATSLLKP